MMQRFETVPCGEVNIARSTSTKRSCLSTVGERYRAHTGSGRCTRSGAMQGCRDAWGSGYWGAGIEGGRGAGCAGVQGAVMQSAGVRGCSGVVM